MDYASIIIPFIGGLGMFIYGMQIMSSGLENAAGDKMKSLLEVLTRNKFFGVLLGAFITAVIQSSSATTVMIVGFVNAGIMNLTQAMGVIMGANIGTTVTGWLVSAGEWAEFLSPSTLAPIAIAIGVIVMLTGKRKTSKDVASIIVGFGLLFIGISTMSDSVSPLRDVPAFRNLFVTLGGNPLLGILVGAVVTAVIQSSSASVGILQSLAAAGLIPFNAAIYIIMGQNIGTCVTAMMSSMGAKKNAKTAALMHLLFNIIGTVIFAIVSIAFFGIANPSWASKPITQTEISTIHTLFNIVTTVLLFPISDWIVKLAKKIGGVEDEEVQVNKVALDERMLQTPSIALQTTISEVGRMGEIVKGTLASAENVLFTQETEDINKIREDEALVDKFSSSITQYTIKLSSLQISEREHQQTAYLLQIVNDIERVSDYLENISEHAEDMKEKKTAFTEMAQAEMRDMMEVCFDSFRFAVEAFANNDKDMALKVIENETKADEMEIKLRARHIHRLTSNQCNTDAGIAYLDTIVCLERISDHARNIAEEVLEHLD